MTVLARRSCRVCGGAGCVDPEHTAWTEVIRGLSGLTPFLAALVWLERATVWTPGPPQVAVLTRKGITVLRPIEPMVRQVSTPLYWWIYLVVRLELWGTWGEHHLAFDYRAMDPLVPDDQPSARSIHLDDDLERISEWRGRLPSERYAEKRGWRRA